MLRFRTTGLVHLINKQSYTVRWIAQNACRVQLKCDGTRWRTVGKVKGKLTNGMCSQYLHTTWEHGVSSITTADAQTSAASIRMKWRTRRFKWTRPFGRKTKSVFCACTITFQTQLLQSISTRCPSFIWGGALGWQVHADQGRAQFWGDGGRTYRVQHDAALGTSGKKIFLKG